MINLLSWAATLGICFYVTTHSGDISAGVLIAYWFLALWLRWWLIERINRVQRQNAYSARVFALFSKYKDQIIVEAITRKEIWKGATTEMLLDSWGNPYEVKRGGEEETWCYGRVGENRYRHRVTIKFNKVKTWTNKN